jgi:hypothetical protein
MPADAGALDEYCANRCASKHRAFPGDRMRAELRAQLRPRLGRRETIAALRDLTKEIAAPSDLSRPGIAGAK